MTAKGRIEARIAEKRAEYANFQAYLEYRKREEDLHGLWDVAIDMSEVSSYIDGLEFALKAMADAAGPLMQQGIQFHPGVFGQPVGKP